MKEFTIKISILKLKNTLFYILIMKTIKKIIKIIWIYKMMIVLNHFKTSEPLIMTNLTILKESSSERQF